MVYLRVFVKVCEGCGVLWLRAQDCREVYCGGCAGRMRSLPQGRRCRRTGRRKGHAAARPCGGGAA